MRYLTQLCFLSVLFSTLSSVCLGQQLRVGDIVYLRCLGHGEGPHFLDGRTGDGSVGLVNTVEGYSGVRWLVESGPGGSVALKCLGSVEGPRYLDGRTGDGSTGLAPRFDGPYSGARWEVNTLNGALTLKCLGTIEGPRFLDGRTGNATVGLAPQAEAPYTGARWEALPANTQGVSAMPAPVQEAAAQGKVVGSKRTKLADWRGAKGTGTFYRNGTLIIEAEAWTDKNNVATRADVFAVLVDGKGRALAVSPLNRIKTAVGLWDPTGASDVFESFQCQFPQEIGPYIHSVDLYFSDRDANNSFWRERIGAINSAVKAYDDLDPKVKAAIQNYLLAFNSSNGN